MKRFLATMAGMCLCMALHAEVIPNGEGFRIGKLENGLSYYLYHNESPKGCADFFIAHNVGALQEEDNQNGLAHFLEHMAFNGTEHYPDKEILNFLAREGVRFGYNVNAYTNRTETVYNVSKVPLVRESFVDSVLVILKDWSCAISCEQKALDEERGVIHEEWRNRDGQRYRMASKQTALLYKGSKQPERTVLGDMDVVLNFRREAILDFYHRWYRPDLQAIIVVGDYDIDDMEARVKRLFSDIPAAVNTEQKGNYAPPAVDGPRFEDMTDPQLRYNALKVFAVQPCPYGSVRNTVEFFKDYYSRQIINTVLSDHFDRLVRKKDCPARSAVVVLGDESPYFYTSQFTLSPKNKTLMDECLAMTRGEIERIVRFGISEEEFEQARFNVLKRHHLNRSDAAAGTDNTDIARCCCEHFLRSYPCLTPEEMRDVKRAVVESLSYKEVATYPSKMFSEAWTIYSNSYNDSEASEMPTEAQMRHIVDSVRNSRIDLPGYISYERASLDVKAEKGSIVKTIRPKDSSYECWVLSNGARVWWSSAVPVKAGNHLSMEMRFDTGLNAFDESDFDSAKYATALMARLAGFAGKGRADLSADPSMSGLSYGTRALKGRYAALSFDASDSKVEDAFKVAYLRIADPYFGSEQDIQRFRSDALNSLAKGKTDAEKYAKEELLVHCGGHPWITTRDSSSICKVDMDFIRDMEEKLYGDPSRLEVFICSDHPAEEIRGYVESYIASLPLVRRSSAKVKYNMLTPDYKRGTHLEKTAARRASPFTEISCCYMIRTADTQRLMATADILDHIMSARYLARIREERGGTYHVSFDSEIYRQGRRSVLESVVAFRTRAELRDILIADVDELMQDMCKGGPSEEEMDKAVKYLIKRSKEKEDRVAASVGWQNDRMMEYVRHGKRADDYPALVKSISAKEVRKLAAKLAGGSTFTSVYEEK